MATVYYIEEHTNASQLHYPYRHLGVVVLALSQDPFARAGLVENVDMWHEGRAYDKISYDAFTLTPEAFKKLEEIGVVIYRPTRADKKNGVPKMNVYIWLKEERERLDREHKNILAKKVANKCSKQDVLHAALSMMPGQMGIEFLKQCIKNSNN